MEMKVQRWLAVWYRCPRCGLQTAQTRMAPTKRNRDDVPEYSPSLKMDEHEIMLMATLALSEATWNPSEFQPFSMTRCTYYSRTCDRIEEKCLKGERQDVLSAKDDRC
jgi:hypothetical protein